MPDQPRRTPRYPAGRARTLGIATRGTTRPNRLRRNDIWLTESPSVAAALNSTAEPLVIDLGFGASAVTTVELADRLCRRHHAVRVLGLEIDPARVDAARPHARPPALDFARGGFELAGRRPQLVRALNVLRQYTERDAAQAWEQLTARLAPGGALVEGTCDELGRVGSWVLLDAGGPRTLTLSCAPQHLDRPATLAERLPKSLIHHNVPGVAIHRLLAELDAAWSAAAPLAVFSPVQRWIAAVDGLAAGGWPVLDSRRSHRRGEVTLAWTALQG